MTLFLRVGLVPAQGTGSTSARYGWWGKELLTPTRIPCIVCPESRRSEKLIDRVRDEGQNPSGIQKKFGGVTCLYGKEGKRHSLFSSSYIQGRPWRCHGSWHVEALDVASFTTGHSNLDVKVAKQHSASAATLSHFYDFCESFQELAQQNIWITLLHPLQLDAHCCDGMNNSGKAALSITERKLLSEFSSILSALFKDTGTLGVPDATAAAGETVEKDILLQPTKNSTRVSGTIANQLSIDLTPVFHVSNPVLAENGAPLQEMMYNSFSANSAFYNLHISLLNKPELTVMEQSRVSQLGPQAKLCRDPCFVGAEELGSKEVLLKWLEERLPSDSLKLSLWGKSPGTKSISNLWYELVDGEIFLEDSCPPRRIVHVASVHIKNEFGCTLVEAYQEMSDGRIRQRNRPLSEKMRRGENVEDACLRGIYEELGWDLGAYDKVSIFQESYKRIEEERESNSYPGLLTKYILHTISAHVNELPATEFCTFEDKSHQIASFMEDHSLINVNWDDSINFMDTPVGVKRHFWKWVSNGRYPNS